MAATCCIMGSHPASYVWVQQGPLVGLGSLAGPAIERIAAGWHRGDQLLREGPGRPSWRARGALPSDWHRRSAPRAAMSPEFGSRASATSSRDLREVVNCRTRPGCGIPTQAPHRSDARASLPRWGAVCLSEATGTLTHIDHLCRRRWLIELEDFSRAESPLDLPKVLGALIFCVDHSHHHPTPLRTGCGYGRCRFDFVAGLVRCHIVFRARPLPI